MRGVAADPNRRARVSKDEDEASSCFEMHRSANAAVGEPALASRCDASQHEGEHHSDARAMRVSMRTSDWPRYTAVVIHCSSFCFGAAPI